MLEVFSNFSDSMGLLLQQLGSSRGKNDAWESNQSLVGFED